LPARRSLGEGGKFENSLELGAWDLQHPTGSGAQRNSRKTREILTVIDLAVADFLESMLGICRANGVSRMNSVQHRRAAGAFTLIEMLCVIGVIAILAALLLPALTQAKARAHRIQCVSDLKQTGFAFQIFAHDHRDRFPMEVPMHEGGSLEFVQNGYAAQGEFYFSFQHFVPLSNTLSTPKALRCPADTDRVSGTDFGSFKNDNLSYFVGVSSRYDRANSILSGDRNITNDASSSASIAHGSSGHPFKWTAELHRFKGNILFADGRVEQLGDHGLSQASGYIAGGGDLFLPTENVGVIASSNGGSSGSNGATDPDSAAPANSENGVSPKSPIESNQIFGGVLTIPGTKIPIKPLLVPTRSDLTSETGSVRQTTRSEPLTNAVSQNISAPHREEKPFISEMIAALHDLIHDAGGLMSLLLLFIVAGALALRTRQYSRQHRRR
jgi:prepilin-type N-terminal cleavage/methylation domain-containing protein/prepilin-type processing-associated H-X9-DG protein